MADQSTFVELDSFTVKMLRNIDVRRRELNALVNNDSTLLAFEQATSVRQDRLTSPPQSPVSSETSEEPESFHELPDGPEIKDQMRRSISALLNIQKEIFTSDEDISEGSDRFEKVKERFREVVSLVPDGCEERSEKPNILTESTNIESTTTGPAKNPPEEPTKANRLGFKERMSLLAKGYYPSQEQEFVKPKPVQTLQKVVAVEQPRQASKENSGKIKELQNIFHSAVQADQQPPAPKPQAPVVFAKKTSVTDLKNIFEQKIEDLNKPKHQVAPELLSLKDKKRLFEKAIREETAASMKAQEMFQKPKKRNFDCQPIKGTGDDEPKRKKSFDSMISPEPDENNHNTNTDIIETPTQDDTPTPEPEAVDKTSLTVREMSIENEASNDASESEQSIESEVEESVLTHSRIIEDSTVRDNDDNNFTTAESSCQLIDEAFKGIELPPSSTEHQDPIEETMDITFSALDNDFDSDANLQRSSTKVNLSSEEPSVLKPSKPPRVFLYNEDSLGNDTPVQAEPATGGTPVLRTISFYRREQKLKKENAQSPGGVLDSPVRFLKQNILPAAVESRSIFQAKIVEKIQALKEEIKEHNRVSSQASTALNMCLSYTDPGFEDARIEAERLLLISAEKRSACFNQIQRYQAVVRHPDKFYPIYCESASRASINICNIKIPFKNDFLVSRAKGNTASTTSYFTCLIVCNGIVHVSELLSANDNVGKDFLNFKFVANFTDLTEDFQITLKLFCLELNTEAKSKDRSKTFRVKFGTLLKGSFKKSPISGLPSSSFKSVGRIVLNLPSLKENKGSLYRMNLDTLSTPVDGYITMSVQMNVEHRTFAEGYFDIQEKATSFWNLRYFVLSGEQLKFWRFKDDMKDKKPLEVIELKNCLNPKLSILQGTEREVCMRPNTFVIFTIQPPEVSNTEKLLKGGIIHKVEPERYLISSASKDDSVLFCTQLNQVLRNIRTWSNDCVRPYSVDEFNRLLQAKQ